jgi:hypothetical protein
MDGALDTVDGAGPAEVLDVVPVGGVERVHSGSISGVGGMEQARTGVGKHSCVIR